MEDRLGFEEANSQLN